MNYNKQQLKAINYTEGPFLCVAGAGTGKTTLLIGRLIKLIESKKASLEEILLLTFTEKGAGEMEDRALKALPMGSFDPWIMTFHKFGERILRNHAIDIGLDPGFKLLTQTEQWIMIKKNLDQFELDYYRPLGNPNKFIMELIKHFSRLKDENITAEEYLKYVEELEEDLDNMLGGKSQIPPKNCYEVTGQANPKSQINPKSKIQNIKTPVILNEVKNPDSFATFTGSFAGAQDDNVVELSRLKELANAYHTYNQLLLKQGYLDFGDLINYVIKLFKERPNILKHYQQKFKYVMVDEFQDTNWSQYELMKILVNKQSVILNDSEAPALHRVRGKNSRVSSANNGILRKAQDDRNSSEAPELSSNSVQEKTSLQNNGVKPSFGYPKLGFVDDPAAVEMSIAENSAEMQANLMVVGDDNQAIFRFRGASMSNIMQFKDDYPKAQAVVLNDNYRSGQTILDLAYTFIKNNDPNTLEIKLGISKELRSKTEYSGEIETRFLSTATEEVSWVADEIIRLKSSEPGLEYSDLAILVRTNALADAYTAELNAKEIPNTFVSLKGLYYKPLIMDIIAYLNLLDNYHESASLFRVLNMENFKIGHGDIININRFAKRKNWSLYEALKNIAAITDVGQEARTRVGKLTSFIAGHSKLAQELSVSALFVRIINDLKVHKDWDHDRDKGLFSLLNQFYQKIKKFEADLPGSRLKDFMEYLRLELESGETGALKLDYEDSDTVRIMTAHAAKGLEFKYVFLCDLVDKKFPTINRKDLINIPDAMVREALPESKEVHIEEERRLFYVALTRAKEKLYLCGAKDYGGAREKKPSLFLKEAGIEVSDDTNIAVEEKELWRDVNRLNTKSEILNTKFTLLNNEKLNRARSQNSKFKIQNNRSSVIASDREAIPTQDASGSGSFTPLRSVQDDRNSNGIAPPSRFSFSQIEAYNKCPLQYKFNFILKIPVEAKAVFVFGRVMHNTLREFFLPLESGAGSQLDLFRGSTPGEIKPGEKELLDIYKKNWQDDGYGSKQEKDEYRKLGMKMLKDFYNDLEEGGWPEVMFLEKAFQMNIAGYSFKGAIDRIDVLPDGSLEVVDYKTGEAPEKVYYQQKKQLLLYKLALEEIMAKPVSKLTFHYLKGGVKKSFEGKDKDLEKLQNEIKDTIANIASGEFPPKPGQLCKYCDFGNICEFRSA